jgi:hypothetical protein
MKTPDLQPTIDDLRIAVLRECGDKAAARIERRARHIVWERLAADNRRATDALLATLESLTGPAWLQAQDRVTALFAEHSALMECLGGGEVGHGA